jgi:hypothetical protein
MLQYANEYAAVKTAVNQDWSGYRGLGMQNTLGFSLTFSSDILSATIKASIVRFIANSSAVCPPDPRIAAVLNLCL